MLSSLSYQDMCYLQDLKSLVMLYRSLKIWHISVKYFPDTPMCVNLQVKCFSKLRGFGCEEKPVVRQKILKLGWFPLQVHCTHDTIFKIFCLQETF